jgi:membrane-associated phospholipid phosphatase
MRKGTGLWMPFLLLFLLSIVVSLGTSNALDHSLLSNIVSAQTPRSLQFWRYVTWMGAPYPITAAAIFSALVFFLRNNTAASKFMLLCILIAIVLDRPLKFLIHRARPIEDIAGVMPTSFSFPSGHVLFATTFYFALALVVSKNQNTASRRMIWLFASFVVLLVFLSRLCLGVHYPVDVIGGLLSGWLCISVAQWLVTPSPARWGRSNKH